MSNYPREAWIFGTVTCQVRKVTLVEHSRFGNSELDAKGNCYRPDELFRTRKVAFEAVERYLARKQLIQDRRQAIIDRQRKNLENQRSKAK